MLHFCEKLRFPQKHLKVALRPHLGKCYVNLIARYYKINQRSLPWYLYGVIYTFNVLFYNELNV